MRRWTVLTLASLLLGGCDGSPGDDDVSAACEAAASEDACAEIDVGEDHLCAWVRTLTVDTIDTCDPAETFACLAYPNIGGTPGCAPIPGCEPSGPGTLVSPAFRPTTGGGVQNVDVCGPPAPVGFTGCASGIEGEDEPACACACEAPP